MRHVQESTDDQINRRNDMRHWEEARLVSVEISTRRKVRQCSLVSQENLSENDFLKLTFAIRTLSIRDNQSA
jgi:hypothetical protein